MYTAIHNHQALTELVFLTLLSPLRPGIPCRNDWLRARPPRLTSHQRPNDVFHGGYHLRIRIIHAVPKQCRKTITQTSCAPRSATTIRRERNPPPQLIFRTCMSKTAFLQPPVSNSSTLSPAISASSCQIFTTLPGVNTPLKTPEPG